MGQRRKPKPGTPEADAAEAGLVYVSDTEPGISRRGAGRGFSYRGADGQRVTDPKQLQRIRALAIPPAYSDVWICRSPRGHLQATGRDARQRKQYRYHAAWQAARGEGKFGRLPAFAKALPSLRQRLAADLKLPGYPKDKVLSIVVAILAETLVRVGNDHYARSNRSYGLSTLRDRHVDFVRGGRARITFRGKAGQKQELMINDARLVKLVRGCQDLPGQALFQYRDDEGGLVPVSSGDVNDYLRSAMAGDFTAKDFRTWGGTLLAFRKLAGMPPPEDGEPASERALASMRNDVVGEVSQVLGNTPAVCRKAYIDPLVFEGWEQGRLQAFTRNARGARQWEAAARRYLVAARRSHNAQA